MYIYIYQYIYASGKQTCVDMGWCGYGVAMTSRLLKIIGLLCKKAV